MEDKELKKEVKKYIQKNYGKKCKEFNFGCAVCIAWAFYDYIFEEMFSDLFEDDD